MQAKFRKDLLSKKGTVGNVLNAHRDELFSCKTADELKSMLSRLFAENNLTSPKARLVLAKTEAMHYLNDIMLYIQNIIFASSKLATY